MNGAKQRSEAPQVSIIVPCYNRLQYLRHAVNSVRSQSFQDWELIVADDGSDGETATYLKELDSQRKIRVLRLPRIGNPGIVRNAALRMARGMYVAFLDSDDVWLPTKLESQIAVHRSCARRRWSYVAMERIHGDGNLMRGEPRRATPEGAIFEQLLRLVADVSMSSVMAERALLEQLGGFDEALPYFEDFDLFLRLSLCSEVSVVTNPLVCMRSHAQHYSADRVGMLSGRARLLAKMAPDAARLGIAAILDREKAKNYADLARACAAAGRRREAIRFLWQARKLWHAKPWRRACIAAAMSFAPGRLRAVYRRLRYGGHYHQSVGNNR
jgi:glycosyltransferase involved in cell wall biosynthesis